MSFYKKKIPPPELNLGKFTMTICLRWGAPGSAKVLGENNDCSAHPPFSFFLENGLDFIENRGYSISTFFELKRRDA